MHHNEELMTRSFWFCVVFLVALPAVGDEDLAAQGKPAPMFRLPVYNAKLIGAPVVGLERYVGNAPTDKQAKAVLLTFMASFCGPCKKEMPYLQSLHEKYADKGLRVVMVSIDADEPGQKIVGELIEKNKVTFPVLKDRFNLVARRWLGAQSPLPSVFMVKPDGVVSMVHRGYSEEATALLDKEVQLALDLKK